MHTILLGDCRATLKGLPEKSIQCVVTSPPYWGLRSYLPDGSPMKDLELGTETSPETYVDNIVEVFREVWRVLRDDGVAWVNLGDSYCGSPKGSDNCDASSTLTKPRSGRKRTSQVATSGMVKQVRNFGTTKPKDLVGIPWAVAFALRDDGWYLRQDVIWAKSSCMPEPVTDRCTKSHEYLFMLTKKPRYYYDADAIREPLADSNAQRTTHHYNTKDRYRADNGGNDGLDDLAARMREGEHTSRNKRSVWNVNPRPYDGAHFAVMPPLLIEPCILAGSRPGDTVLDPFGGSGTVGMVANWHGRDSILCELNPEYVPLIEERVKMNRTETGGWEEPAGGGEPSVDLIDLLG